MSKVGRTLVPMLVPPDGNATIEAGARVPHSESSPVGHGAAGAGHRGLLRIGVNIGRVVPVVLNLPWLDVLKPAWRPGAAAVRPGCRA
jgi:hypothetical protein